MATKEALVTAVVCGEQEPCSLLGDPQSLDALRFNRTRELESASNG
jgi:hypothetical protein